MALILMSLPELVVRLRPFGGAGAGKLTEDSRET
jgi:hypothetical protein